MGGFAGTSASVVEEEEQRVVPLAQATVSIWSGKEGVDFVFLKIRYGRQNGFTAKEPFQPAPPSRSVRERAG